jgi:hypothetical protein
MFFVELVFALVLAVVLSLLLTGGLGWRRPGQGVFWSNVIFLFFLFFLISWAGGVWLPSFGPMLWGGYYLPFLLTALIVVLVLLAIVPPRVPGLRRGESVDQRVVSRENPVVERTLGVFFWVLAVGLCTAIVIVIHYIR